MMKRALSVVAVLVATCLSGAAQEPATANALQTATINLTQASPSDLVAGEVALQRTGSFRALNNAWYGRGPLTLDARLFSFPNAFGWVEGTPGDFLPTFMARPLPRLIPPVALGFDPTGEFDLERPGDYVGGEVSVFYGKSTGKFSREVKAGHILGEIVHGNTHITVGASYEESNGRRPVLIGH